MSRVCHILDNDGQVKASVDLEYVKTISSGYNKHTWDYHIFINDEVITSFSKRENRDEQLTKLCQAFENYKNSL